VAGTARARRTRRRRQRTGRVRIVTADPERRGSSVRGRLAAIALLLVSTATLVSSGPITDVSASVTVDATARVGRLRTQLETQIKYPFALDRALGTKPLLRTLGARLIRINATADGCCWPGGPAPMIPAGLVKGSWDFSSLDSVVSDITAVRAQTVLNISRAPEWMWDCTTRTIRDLTFGEFGEYMARLVAYYNKGSFVAEDGRTITNPAGVTNRITHWELWNEPDLDSLACLPNRAPNITPAQYVAMWNATMAKMFEVDNSIKLIGPATDAPQYVTALIAGAIRKPDALTFHGYAGGSIAQSDQLFFDGLDEIVSSLARIRASAAGIPVWITELNVNAAGSDDPTHRPYNAFGAAWGASAFRRLALGGAAAIFHYEFAHPENPIYQMVDPSTGIARLPYWRDFYLARYFPPGSRLLAASSSASGIETLAARAPRSRNVRVLVVNRQVDSPMAVGGPGLPATVQVTVANLRGVAQVTLRQLDDATPLASGPPATALPAGNTATVSFSGYGAALLEFITAWDRDDEDGDDRDGERGERSPGRGSDGD
jgi:hypothetical protein